MALIICPECKKEVSDKAASCPNCGFPIETKGTTNDNVETLQPPEFAANLHIGRQLDSIFNGQYQQDENSVRRIKTGKIKVIQHTHGVALTTNLFVPIMEIHSSQIISMHCTSKSELLRIEKSVIGRAVVGGLILGPLGAIVGGMSGIGTKQKIEDKSFLVINYWEKYSKSAQTLLISGNKGLIRAFIRRNAEENKINETQNRQADTSKAGCLGAILLIIGLAFTYYML